MTRSLNDLLLILLSVLCHLPIDAIMMSFFFSFFIHQIEEINRESNKRIFVCYWLLDDHWAAALWRWPCAHCTVHCVIFVDHFPPFVGNETSQGVSYNDRFCSIFSSSKVKKVYKNVTAKFKILTVYAVQRASYQFAVFLVAVLQSSKFCSKILFPMAHTISVEKFRTIASIDNNCKLRKRFDSP